ncbi:MAG: PD40 domain-containing protein [Bacteroidales bacterium]|nr:PD40 domain-containing protein [Bacteroidales bacterium]
MKHPLILLLAVLLFLPAFGQNKKSEPLFEQAVEKGIAKKHEEAIKLLHKALDIDPNYVEAWLLLGRQYLALERYPEARESYQHSLDLGSKSPRWQREAKEGIRVADFRQHAVEHPVPFRPINLGPNVNTEDDEYLPALTADYRMLVFTRRSPRRATTAPGLPQEEDFYCSMYDTMELNWGPAHRMPEPLNSNGNEGAQTISHDGRVVIFTACGRSGEPTGCDIYMSVRQGGRWGKPRNLGAPVNSVHWESFPSLSIDGYTLYFVSNRPGGYGGTDIWCSTLEEGRWSEPRNLGPEINTPGNETAPYIHFDDKTLYFASDGHIGMGGMDLFRAKRTSDSTWGEVKNLGYPINTSGEENNLIVAPDGRTAIFSSDRYGGYGKHDLYSFVMPAPVQPERITFIDPVVQAENLLSLGDTVTLNNIHFLTASAELYEASKAGLDRLAEALKRHPRLRLEVGGHTDAVGKEEDNMVLSERRAKAVYDYLVERGVAAERLTYKGYGETRPVADNNTKEGRAMNRRTTLTPIR